MGIFRHPFRRPRRATYIATTAVVANSATVSIGAGADDAYESNVGAVTLTNTAVNVNTTDSPYVILLFRNLPIPAGATLTNNTKLEVYCSTYDDPGLTIQAEATASPATPTTGANNISSRTVGAGSVNWTATNIGTSGYAASPSVASLVQEVVKLPGYTQSVSDIAFILHTTGSGHIRFFAFDSGVNYARLQLEWTGGGAGAQDIAPSGLSVASASGTATVGRGAVSVAPAGKAAAVAAGTATIGRGAVGIAPSGLAVGAAYGTATVGTGAVSIAPSGLAVGAAFGTAAVGRGAVNVAPSGLAVGVAFGTAVVGTGAPTIAPAGLAVGAAFGTATVGRGAVSVVPAGLAVSAAFGTATIGLGVAPAGLAVAAAFGTAVVGRGAVSIAPAGLAVGATIGTATVGTGVQTIAPAGLAVAAGIGAAVVVGPQSVAPAGLAVSAGLGAPGVVLRGIGLYGVATTSSSTSASEWSLSATSGGVHRYAVVIAHLMRDTANDNFEVMAVYGGETMVPLVLWTYPDTPRTRTYAVLIFGLIAPPAGAQTVTVTLEEGHTAEAAVVTVLALANVSQTTPTVRTGGANIVGSTTASARVYDGLVGSWLVGGATMRGGDLTFTPGAGMTEVYDLVTGSSTTDDLTATGSTLPLLVAASYRDWIATSNALDYGVAAAVEVRPAMVVYPAGLAVGVGVGGASVQNLADVRPAGLAVGLGIGAAAVGTAGTMVGPSGLAVAVALGDAVVEAGGVILAPAGLAVDLALGAAAVGQMIAPEGLAVAVEADTAALVGSAATVEPSGLAVGIGTGTARLWMHRVAAAVVADGYETPAGAVFLGTTSLNVEVSQPWVGMMTGALDMPAAATIVDARLLLTTVTHDDPKLEAACELSAEPVTLTTAMNNISGRSLTVARARWEVANVGLGAVQSHNMGAVVQEVVNLPEWEPGAQLLFVWRDLGTGGWLRWYSADAAAQYRPTVQIDWQFGAADLDLVPAGLEVAAGMGDVVVGAGAVGVVVDGLAVAVAAGAPVVSGGVVGIAPEGLAVAAGLGDVTVVGGLLDIAPEGLAVAAGLGEAALGRIIAPAGLALGAIGAPVIGRGAVAVAVDGLAVGLGMGAPVVLAGGLLISPAGLALGAIGAPVVGRGGVAVAVDGLAVGLGMGAATVGLAVVAIAPEGLAVGVGLGAATVGRGPVGVTVGGLAVAAGVGAVVVRQVVTVEGLAVGVEVGAADVRPVVAVAGLPVAVGIGTADVAITLQRVTVGGLAVGVVVGAAMVALARQPWPLTVRARGNGLTVAARGHGLTLWPRNNELTVEDRTE